MWKKTTELTTPSVWFTTNRVDGTNILDYFTNEPATSPETTTLNLEPNEGYLVFAFSNQVDTATATNTDQGIHTTTDGSREQTVDSSMTLPRNVTEESKTELKMENWYTKTDILGYSTIEAIIFTSTVNQIS